MQSLSFITLLAAFLSLEDAASKVSTRGDLIGFITACAAQIKEIDVVFTSRRTDLIPDLRPARLGNMAGTGTYRLRIDGREFLTVTEVCDARGERQATISLVGKRQEHLRDGRLTINRDHFGSTRHSGRPGHLFALQALSTVWAKHLQASAKVLGIEELDGRPCLHFVFSASPFQRDGTLTAVGEGRDAFVWLDLRRGGNVLRWEFSMKGRINSRYYYKLANRSGVWLPVAFKKETYIGPDAKERSAPTILHECELDLSTAKINQGLPDSAFAIDPPPGTYVNDMLNDRRYRVGGTPPRADAY